MDRAGAVPRQQSPRTGTEGLAIETQINRLADLHVPQWLYSYEYPIRSISDVTYHQTRPESNPFISPVQLQGSIDS
jgi:hypothetical protein